MSISEGERRVELTSNSKVFMNRLRPGDVLLLDSMQPVSHIIKLAENNPANHAAMFIGDGQYIHATAPRAGSPAITEGSIETWLESGTHRTITAFRHDLVSRRKLKPDDVVEQAQQMRDTCDDYALVELISLVIPTFWRTYHASFGKRARATNPNTVRLFDFLSKSLLADIKQVATQRPAHPDLDHQNAMTVTCSELVYLSYDRIMPGCIELTEPLTRWPAANAPAMEGEATADAEAALGKPSFDLDPPIPKGARIPALPQPSEGAPPEGSPLQPGPQQLIQLAQRAIRVITGEAYRNLALGKYGSERPTTGTPLADCVTPRDLYTSPSLRAKVVFHLPPHRLARPPHVMT